MFIFISKLLPLFLYPLGLACVLLVVALVMSWRNPRWVPIPVALALIVLLVSSNTWVTNSLIRSLEWQYLPTSELPEADVIVILGGATKPPFPPRPTPEVDEAGDRVLYGAQLYREGKAPWVIPAGGRIVWGSSSNNSSQRLSSQSAQSSQRLAPESEDMAQILEDLGVPRAAIIQESRSLNTHQNAVNVRKILDQRDLRKVLLVTSAIHMPRSVLVFRRQGIDVIPAPTDFLVSQYELDEPNSSSQAALLHSLPNADQLSRITRAIKEYIGIVAYRIRGWV
ncbi:MULTISPECIES: YdcF family protein [unclassified Moorena]|uniref:YdcF family protein n=1 Tax=unclassified Moorena TaxID=2683338 RepID=UPI0013CA3E42|nr:MULTISPECIES: YdcF family protein [unclassified Moorena]NEO19117.1 YdcF family protein [Moorena sp. SIO4A5]NEP20763.1 YdcF family protein [Moorena sp. SIO3I6]NEQ57117.1 YdcF family protein [Moorena sp. SIO4A1]